MRRPVRSSFVAALALVFLGSCDDLDVLGPTPADEGIIFYIHANFAGSSQQVNADVANLDSVEGPCVSGDGESSTATWDDCISSVRVLPGWSATLYKDRDYHGSNMTITEDVLDLKTVNGSCDGSFNDCVSSIRVMRRSP
jgi:peptidase inhibitor family I36